MIERAPAITKEIRELMDIQIRVFGQPTALTPFELDDGRLRAQRIKLLGQELDRISFGDNFRNSLGKHPRLDASIGDQQRWCCTVSPNDRVSSWSMPTDLPPRSADWICASCRRAGK